MKHVKVLERVYDPRRLRTAWQQVKRNAGAAGIDQMTVEAFERRKDELLALIYEKLKAGNYRFKPARRAMIPKEGSAKMRKLGIPVVMDRVVSQSTNLVFQEIFEPDFSRSNYGSLLKSFIHNRSAPVQKVDFSLKSAQVFVSIRLR